MPNIWRPGRVRDTKIGTDFSNEMLLNIAKFQGYIQLSPFQSYYGIINRGGGEVKLHLFSFRLGLIRLPQLPIENYKSFHGSRDEEIFYGREWGIPPRFNFWLFCLHQRFIIKIIITSHFPFLSCSWWIYLSKSIKWWLT